MSSQHPIVAVTGSSGAGSPVVTTAIRHVLERLGVGHAIIDGDGFHRYERNEFPKMVSKAEEAGRHLSHFSPEANLLDLLESLMREFGEKGRGMHRKYIHDEKDAQETGGKEGTFTPWEPIPEGTNILIYEGLHGCFVSETVDIARYVDLKIGVVPIVNLEWMQKIQQDTSLRGYSLEAVMRVVERRLSDYVHHITPQFALTDINFQRIPLVDTANPFEAQVLPTLNESMIIIRFRSPKSIPFPIPNLLKMLPGAAISRQNNVLIPGHTFEMGMQVILEPLLERLLSHSRVGLT